MTKKERLEAIITTYFEGKTLNFARHLGIAPSTVSSWMNRNSLDYDLIFAKCNFISARWLLTGEGEMNELRSANFSPNKNSQSDINCADGTNNCSVGTEKVFPREEKERNESPLPVARQTNKIGEGIPLIPFEAMAGVLTSEQTILEYECERYVIPVFKGADFLMPIKGSSMYPKYSSGDIVACQRVPMSGLFFQWNKVYVIDTNQGPLIKRIKPGSDHDHVLIVSDNPNYDPFQLAVQDIHAVALVIGVIRLE